MANLNIQAVGKSFTLSIDDNGGWQSFDVNGQSIQAGGTITVDSLVNFSGMYTNGSPSAPWYFLPFINFGLSNSYLWVAIIRFSNADGGCQVDGQLQYASETTSFNVNQLVESLQATNSQQACFSVGNAGTSNHPATPLLFSANGLTGYFSANIKVR